MNEGAAQGALPITLQQGDARLVGAIAVELIQRLHQSMRTMQFTALAFA